MSKSLLSSAIALCLMYQGSALAVETCRDRAEAIKDKIVIAKQNQNKWKIAGLEKALSDLTTHCTDKSLAEKLTHRRDKLQSKLAKKQADIEEAIDKINRAKAHTTQPEKLTKAANKLASKQREREVIEQKLHEVQRGLGK